MDGNQIRHLAKKLHERMAAWGDMMYFPTGGVFLTLNRDKLLEGIKAKNNPSNEVVRQVYAQWHETVHMLQLVTSPFVFMNVLGLASLAKTAVAGKFGPEEIACMRESFKEFSSRLFFEPGKISHWHLLEAHAVAQALMWLAPGQPNQLWEFATYFYGKNHEYLRLPNWCCDQLKKPIDIKLFCRLSVISLQSDDPISMFQGLISYVSEKNYEELLATCDPDEFCRRLGVDPNFVAKSLRERKSPFQNHPYMETFSIYLDEYETLDIREKLDLLMCKDAKSASFFKPLFTVYPDGDVTLARYMPEPLANEYKSLLISGTFGALEGLKVLTSR